MHVYLSSNTSKFVWIFNVKSRKTEDHVGVNVTLFSIWFSEQELPDQNFPFLIPTFIITQKTEIPLEQTTT